MSRKFGILMGLAFVLFTNIGCCRMADRWCHNNQPPAPQYCVPAPQACAPVAYAPQQYAPQACPPPNFQRPMQCP